MSEPERVRPPATHTRALGAERKHRPSARSKADARHTKYVILGFSAALLVLAIVFAGTYYATNFVLTRLGVALSPALLQVINSLLGLIVALVIFTSFSYTMRARAEALQRNIFGPIVDAMNRIAQGDFTVRIDEKYNDDDRMSVLVQSVNTMARELNEMEEMRQEFISDVSHEIQSPLTSIRGFARALQDDQLEPAARAHYLNIIETESMRLSKLSDNLLALAALDAKGLRIEPTPYRLDQQLSDLLLTCEPQWASKGLEVELQVAPVTITADPDLLSQVWLNLLHNAIKFTPSGGKLCVSLQAQAERVEVQVADTGVGISDEDLQRIFERFYKADKARDRSLGGNGLGLAIAKKIVDLHSGTITAVSRVGAGTTFTVTLPLQP